MLYKSLLATLLAISLLACQNESSQKSTGSESNSATHAEEQTEDIFKHEGNLVFTDSEENVVRNLDIEIADNEYERERGLMHRRYLPENAGMLFIFNKDEYRSFWMKNTAISLDILFIGEDKVINTIQKYTVPFSEASVPSAAPSTYVLEVNAGYCDTHGITEGMKISWEKMLEKQDSGME